MAGRKQKLTVEYFPHYVDHGRVLFIMESTWGALGYAAFYKLMEVLGKSEGHYFRAGNCEGQEYLAAKMGVTPEILQEMLCKLVKMGVIDRELWEKTKVIWMQSFVESLEAVYRKRIIPVPEIPKVSLFLPPEIGHKPPSSGISAPEIDPSGAGNRQSKVKRSKVKNIIHTAIGSDGVGSKQPSNGHFDLFWEAYPKKKKKQDAVKAFEKINPGDELLHFMIQKIEQEKATHDWVKEGGRFIPYPSTWLNGRRWEDEGVEVPPAGGNNSPGLTPPPVKSVVCPNCGKDTDEVVDGKCIYCIERKSVKHLIDGIGKLV